MQIGGIESFYQWNAFCPEVLKYFKHKSCLILIEIFKSIYCLNLYKCKYFDHNWIVFVLKMFQYLGSKYVPSAKNVSIPFICILLMVNLKDIDNNRF